MGFSACKIYKFPLICATPVMPKNRNQTNIIGPNALPSKLVPAFWQANKTEIIINVIKMTRFWSLFSSWSKTEMLCKPSMAVVMVTAGVSTPSASSAAPPNMAGMTKYLP